MVSVTVEVQVWVELPSPLPPHIPSEHAARIVLLAASPTRRSAGTLCARRWQPRRLFSPCQALSASQQQAAAARRQLYCGWPSRNGCSGPKGGQLTPAGNYS
ncbi:hypothetical protein EMIHUDRAFT_242403 [Emiliania huxleyi CCMP1516]|uniref:Uncharacterized protein n=2 Tax=Emiliania huxleyi TaxID=2903 RepID=A0A0D3J9D7_EMIH1|nr:hypothetical protein EMIHUDRAFT_242403 [Emiliania huxleyi CCMP1516]EOD20122.1 hypothetical protein EMIHUDRAFT_242403 [Emiliania huxleyi CCMP1516]|eukprot:XP_005772551.1 hypothetical protein EMIHUDRAFT_242403 [Emiliania huxleyi CCMP1516]